jgi:hypothetical protein
MLVNAIPPQVREQYPEIENYIIPAVVTVYEEFYKKFSGDHKRLLQIINDIATGIEAASAPPNPMLKTHEA